MAFAICKTVQEEMAWIAGLRAESPETAAVVLANSKLLVELAESGQVRAILDVVASVDNLHKQTLSYYYIKMFQAACLNRRMDVMKYMLDNGFNAAHPFLQDLLHRVIEDASVEDDALQPVVRCLLHADVDVNYQRKRDLFTPLHVACTKNFVGVAALLLLYDADVNAVANDDLMPLNCAERVLVEQDVLADEATIERNAKLIRLLLDNHAKRTWRRPKPEPEPVERAASSFKILSFSSAHNCSAGRLFDTDNA
ncbi:hypothetical protein ACHHYP_02560 [Achlya hypogyna]|uniref:Uncharacterized protein n=1 Tax=Achlya hypogyna TaxID=1202772 RepID=A0A1V9Z5Y4_ACHHY|nr:hypothetical protein ACHHYP_02560 [Achlya hypogyna]